MKLILRTAAAVLFAAFSNAAPFNSALEFTRKTHSYARADAYDGGNAHGAQSYSGWKSAYGGSSPAQASSPVSVPPPASAPDHVPAPASDQAPESAPAPLPNSSCDGICGAAADAATCECGLSCLGGSCKGSRCCGDRETFTGGRCELPAPPTASCDGSCDAIAGGATCENGLSCLAAAAMDLVALAKEKVLPEEGRNARSRRLLSTMEAVVSALVLRRARVDWAAWMASVRDLGAVAMEKSLLEEYARLLRRLLLLLLPLRLLLLSPGTLNQRRTRRLIPGPPSRGKARRAKRTRTAPSREITARRARSPRTRRNSIGRRSLS